MADDIEKGLGFEEAPEPEAEDTTENGLNIDNGVVPVSDEEEDSRARGFTSAESTPEHLLTERTPLTKSSSRSNDIELHDLKKKKRHLTEEVVDV